MKKTHYIVCPRTVVLMSSRAEDESFENLQHCLREMQNAQNVFLRGVLEHHQRLDELEGFETSYREQYQSIISQHLLAMQSTEEESLREAATFYQTVDESLEDYAASYSDTLARFQREDDSLEDHVESPISPAEIMALDPKVDLLLEGCIEISDLSSMSPASYSNQAANGSRHFETIPSPDIAQSCVICQDDFGRCDSERKPIVKTSCDHLFHRGCLKKWMITSSNLTCPVCRSPIQKG